MFNRMSIKYWHIANLLFTLPTIARPNCLIGSLHLLPGASGKKSGKSSHGFNMSKVKGYAKQAHINLICKQCKYFC